MWAATAPCWISAITARCGGAGRAPARGPDAAQPGLLRRVQERRVVRGRGRAVGGGQPAPLGSRNRHCLGDDQRRPQGPGARPVPDLHGAVQLLLGARHGRRQAPAVAELRIPRGQVLPGYAVLRPRPARGGLPQARTRERWRVAGPAVSRPADKKIFGLVLQDLSRHLRYGTSRARYMLDRQPARANEMVNYVRVRRTAS